jgi:hypothetical protein
MPLKQLFTGFFCLFGALSAAATSLSFGGRLRQTELPKSYKLLRAWDRRRLQTRSSANLSPIAARFLIRQP